MAYDAIWAMLRGLVANLNPLGAHMHVSVAWVTKWIGYVVEGNLGPSSFDYKWLVDFDEGGMDAGENVKHWMAKAWRTYR